MLHKSNTIDKLYDGALTLINAENRCQDALWLSSQDTITSFSDCTESTNSYIELESFDTRGEKALSQSMIAPLVSSTRTKRIRRYSIPCLRDTLTPETGTALIEFISSSALEAKEIYDGSRNINWCSAKSRRGVSIHHAQVPPAFQIDLAVKSSCIMMATYDEVADFLITETPQDFSKIEESIDPSKFLNANLLHTLVPRTPDDRFICLKWLCTKSEEISVVKPRDYIYLEVIDHYIDQKGRKVGYRHCKSIESDDIDDTDVRKQFIRGKLLSLDMFIETIQGETEFYSMHIYDFTSPLPPHVIHRLEDSTALRCADLRDCIDRKRLAHILFMQPNFETFEYKRTSCNICMKRFSFVRKKYVCASCCVYVCNHCTKQCPDLTTVLRGSRICKSKNRLCMRCSLHLRSIRLPKKAHAWRATENKGKYSGHASEESSDLHSVKESDVRSSLCSTTITDASSIDSFVIEATGQTSKVRSQVDRHVLATEAQEDSGSDGTEDSSCKSTDELDTRHEFCISSVKIDLGIGKCKEEAVRLVPDNLEMTSASRAQAAIRASMLESLSYEIAYLNKPYRSFANCEGELSTNSASAIDRTTMTSSTPNDINSQNDNFSPSKSLFMICNNNISESDLKLQMDRADKVARSVHSIKHPGNHTPLGYAKQSTTELQSTGNVEMGELQNRLNQITELSHMLRKTILGSSENVSEHITLMDTSRHSNDESDISKTKRTMNERDSNHNHISESVTFSSGDRKFLDLLSDSSVYSLKESDPTWNEWKIVHSKTTDKMYFFNEFSGDTSWTIPDMSFEVEGTTYMVL